MTSPVSDSLLPVLDDGNEPDGARAPSPPDHPRDSVAALLADFPQWKPVDLAGLWDKDLDRPVPDVLTTVEGSGLLYRGRVNGFHGDAGIGKSWLCCLAIFQVLEAGGRVGLLDFEDYPDGWIPRLRQLGATKEQMARLTYFQASTAGVFPTELVAIFERHDLVVIDSAGVALAAEGKDSWKDGDVAEWFRRFPLAIANLGPAVAVVDHTKKGGQADADAAGSFRKKANFQGASWSVQAVKGSGFVHPDSATDSRPAGGRIKLVCAKDRHGHYRQDEHVANLVMSEKGALALWDAEHDEDGGDRDEASAVRVAEMALRIFEREGEEAMSMAALMKALRDDGLKMSTDSLRGAIDLAVTRKHLAEEPGPRSARMIRRGPRADG